MTSKSTGRQVSVIRLSVMKQQGRTVTQQSQLIAKSFDTKAKVLKDFNTGES